VEQAGTAMQEGTDVARKINIIIHKISIASNEQTDGVDKINKAVAQIDGVTQRALANALLRHSPLLFFFESLDMENGLAASRNPGRLCT